MNKKNKKIEAIDICLIVLLLLALVSGALFLWYLLDYKKSSDFYKEANKDIQIIETKKENKEYEFETNEDFIVSEKEFDIDIDFSKYPETVIGWLYIPDEEKEISYPIMLGKDNDFYLNHDYSNNYNKGGSIFLHYKNSPYLTDYHSVIYGHNMKNGTMFGRLKKYRDKDFLDSHRYVYIKTRDGELKEYYVYSVFKTEDLSESYNVEIKTIEAQKDFINYTLKNNTSKNTIAFDENKIYRIITLSTCVSGQNKLERNVIHMVEI